MVDRISLHLVGLLAESAGHEDHLTLHCILQLLAGFCPAMCKRANNVHLLVSRLATTYKLSSYMMTALAEGHLQLQLCMSSHQLQAITPVFAGVPTTQRLPC